MFIRYIKNSRTYNKDRSIMTYAINKNGIVCSICLTPHELFVKYGFAHYTIYITLFKNNVRRPYIIMHEDTGISIFISYHENDLFIYEGRTKLLC